MKEIAKGLSVSKQLYDFVSGICRERDGNADDILASFASIIRGFAPENERLLQARVDLQEKIDEFFKQQKDRAPADKLVNELERIGYISEKKTDAKVSIDRIDAEIYPMAGPQLVVPADKVNMVLNAANARWVSFYNSLYTSNIIDEKITEVEERKAAVKKYANDFLDKIVQWNWTSWNDIDSFKFDTETAKVVAVTKDNKDSYFSKDSESKLVGFTRNSKNELETFILENNRLKIEIILDKSQKIKDVVFESALTYIIDLEDASISAPENKYEAYRILKGIADGDLECEVRGETRRINKDSEYIDAKTLLPQVLKRASLPLVRDVGAHMVADGDIITVDGNSVPEKILDMFITSFIGLRYHVAPKMHGAEEVAFTCRVWDKINQVQGLPKNANKIGIMNEELRLNAQLADAVVAAKDIVFFTNTGFLDYTGSFIDLMMHQGAIAPYRKLPSQLYKTSYEVHNVNISLALGVPQIGAGMWAAIKDMVGLLKSKEGQVKGLTDTGWSPSPMAASIHAVAFHIFGDVRHMQDEYKRNIKVVNIADMFTFPAADLANLNEKEILENLDFAIHGLLAYAEPWVRRGIGCSGVKDLSGEPLMEDRATARIKAAFARNWLLHGVVTIAQLEDSIKRMAKLVDEQNVGMDGYKPLCTTELVDNNWDDADEAVRAVYEVVFNPLGLKHSYVEPYFYPANRRQQNEG
ncbi:MAG: malate synthase [Rickettsiaceae bacterium]|jgi:malate synthase|nr:malate synthase [Rickettsiaceae bacterium]